MTEKQNDTPLGTEPPPFLGEEGTKEWRRIWRQVAKLGFFMDIDRQNLASYCKWYERYLKYARQVDSNGGYFETETGYRTKDPTATLEKEAYESMLKCSKEFGLTPAARLKLGFVEKGKKDELTDFLKKRGKKTS